VPLFQETFNESRADKAPLSAHPAFPAIVALWFAALLGLGSLVLPIALIERLATLTGIALIVPAAKAPLGITARAIIALAAASAGAGIGLLLARKAVDSSSAERLALQAWLVWGAVASLPFLLGRNPFPMLVALIAVVGVRISLHSSHVNALGWRLVVRATVLFSLLAVLLNVLTVRTGDRGRYHKYGSD